jgi:hypothetical protein
VKEEDKKEEDKKEEDKKEGDKKDDDKKDGDKKDKKEGEKKEDGKIDFNVEKFIKENNMIELSKKLLKSDKFDPVLFLKLE